ncbi:putative B3 domain-containing protein [Forsythia ovata]|uniref:B3 domain-containing protein n=1 Tax=Forsythia ovata TaxID=205694 RepID=A0ABD1PVE6_9LAMI
MAAENVKSFFIAIDPERHRDQLIFPRQFTTLYPDLLGSCVILRDLGGRLWHIEVIRSEDRIILTTGWSDFFSHYSLTFGYMVIFEYRGASTFLTSILDHSACEIHMGDPGGSSSTSQPLPSFQITMSAPRFCHRCIFVLGTFASTNIPRFVNDVQIHDAAGRVWQIGVDSRANGVVRRFARGWAEFYTTKNIRPGDTCVFSLINGDVPAFNVFKVAVGGGEQTMLLWEGPSRPSQLQDKPKKSSNNYAKNNTNKNLFINGM